jgi:hypothetical protein
VACPQCGRYVATGSLGRHISQTDGHSVTFFRLNVSAESVTNNQATSDTFADFSDAGFLGNDGDIMNITESPMENPQLEINARRLERFPNAGTAPFEFQGIN